MMSAEEFIRYVFSLVAVAGLVILAITLGGQFGAWAAGALLLVIGAVVTVPLWNRHFDRVADGRTMYKARPEQPKKATEESPY